MDQHLENLMKHAMREARRGMICAQCRSCAKPAGDLQRAALLGTCAIDMAPTDPRPYALMAQVHLALGDADAALLAYRKLATYSVEPGPALVEVARIHLARGRLNRASLWIERALEQGASVAAHALAAEIHARLGNAEEELAHWRAAVAADPRSPSAVYGLGLAHLKRGELGQARLALERVLELSPRGFRRTHFFLGSAYALSGSWRLAREMFACASETG